MKNASLVLLMMFVLAILAACAAPTAPPPQVVKEVQTVIVAGTPVEKVVEKVITATPAPTQAPAATKPPAKKTLVVCMSQEPDTLYQNGGSMQVSRFVGQAGVWDGGSQAFVDQKAFDYQPVALEKFPSFKDGDAKLNKVKVKVGDTIQNAAGLVAKADKEQELDQMVITWKLKPGLKWSDGQPLKASDLVFGYNIYKDKDSGVTSRFLLDRTVSFVAKDDVTFEITTVPGYTNVFYYTDFYNPLPEHILKGVAAKDIKSHAYARKPVGFGPFRVTNWVSGDRIELEKNPNYWRASEGLPKVDNVVFRFIPDTNQLQAQLIAGQCDVGTQDALNTDVIPFFDQAEKNGLVKPYYIAGSTWEHIDFMTAGPKAPKPRPDFFSDVRVRQAIAHGTNRKEMNDKILFGKSNLMDTTVPSSHWAFPKDASAIATYPYDAKKAADLLDAAGWKLGADGVRAKDGQRFSITISTTAANKPREAVMQIFQANMKTIGVEVKLDFPPSTVLFGRGKDSDYMSGNFDLMLYAWVAGPQPTLLVYTCGELPNKDNAYAGQNNTFWCNAEFDKAYSTFLASADRDAAAKNAGTALSIFSKELPALPLYQRINVHATNPRVLNFKPDPTAGELYNIEELDVK